MAAPAKFLFDVDFTALSEHTAKLAEAEVAARQRGYGATRRPKTAGGSPARSNVSRPASRRPPAL
jgi:hypothetical protein